MKQIDDYELIDKDPDEFMRRGREWLEWEAQQIAEDDRADFTHRVQATAILMVSPDGIKWL